MVIYVPGHSRMGGWFEALEGELEEELDAFKRTW
jgi:hypothetical protein